MIDDLRLYLRVDASPEIGAGHFMRCLALAGQWCAEGGRATFVGSYPEMLRRTLDERGIEVVGLDACHPDPRDLRQTSAAIPEAAPVVLDGYGFDAAYQGALRRSERRLTVIDDTGHLPAYEADLLVNQNLDAERVVYSRAPAVRLLGPRYALLRGEFVRCASMLREVPPVARRVLISMGGADRGNLTLEVARAVLAGLPEATTLRLVAGPANPHRAALRRFARSTGGSCEVVCGVSAMPAWLAWADLAVAAAGSTCFELALLGLPAVLVSTADNQLPIAAGMASRGAAFDLGPADRVAPDELARVVRGLALDPERRREMSERGRRLVDGRGAARVVAALKRRAEPVAAAGADA